VAEIRKIPSRHSKNSSDFVETLTHTGVRKGEGACIEWRHCDFEKEMLTVLGTEEDGTKNGEIRYVPICIESGVDIPTLSRWFGHKDGGVLAMKAYWHPRKEHSQAFAKKVTFAA
jgi:hypothetical protein